MINLKFVKEKPLPSTKSCCIIIDDSIHFAGVMKLVDVADSKSAAGDSVPVRVRSPAPRAEDLRRRSSALFFERAKENPDIKIVVVWPGQCRSEAFLCDPTVALEKIR